MATIANMLGRALELEQRTGPYSIKKTDVFQLLRDIINKLPAQFQVMVVKDIDAGTAQNYDLILTAREDINIDSVVVQCDEGTLTGCSLKINGVAVELAGAATFTITATKVILAATALFFVPAGAAVTIHTTTGFTGLPTALKTQLNFTKTP